jgi:hydroxymethylbilane synthase
VTSLVIGTRGSALALWQANHTKARLEALGCAVRLEIVKTQGDKILDVPLAQIGGKGLFVKEIEEALASRRVDLAVHSMKDVPAALMPGLVLAAVSAREDPRDVLCARPGTTLATLPQGAHIGTSSVRRVAQLRARRPDLRISPLRGNVDTRLRKLEAGEYDAIVLAAAGLVRLGHADRISERLDLLPAIGQGILAFETRAGDTAVIDLVRRAVHDEATAACAAVERAFLERLEGGCQTPMACHARLVDGELHAQGLVATLDGGQILRAERFGPEAAAALLGTELAEELLGKGAGEILALGRAGQ